MTIQSGGGAQPQVNLESMHQQLSGATQATGQVRAVDDVVTSIMTSENMKSCLVGNGSQSASFSTARSLDNLLTGLVRSQSTEHDSWGGWLARKIFGDRGGAGMSVTKD